MLLKELIESIVTLLCLITVFMIFVTATDPTNWLKLAIFLNGLMIGLKGRFMIAEIKLLRSRKWETTN